MELIARYGGLPEVLAPFCETAPMLRLRQIGMHCGCEYTACPIYEGKAPYTRYLHSLGAAAIVWNFTNMTARNANTLNCSMEPNSLRLRKMPLSFWVHYPR